MTVHDCPDCLCTVGEAFAPRHVTSTEAARKRALEVAAEAARRGRERRLAEAKEGK